MRVNASKLKGYVGKLVPAKLRYLRGEILDVIFPIRVAQRLRESSRWDEIECDLLEELVTPSRGSIDVGGHVGKYAVRLATLTSKVLVFEPLPELARLLSRTLPKNAHVKQVALSNQTAFCVFHIPVADGHDQTTLGSLEPGLGCERTITVSSASLDDFVDFDAGLLKIDVEGHEFEVLLGGTEFLTKQQPVIIVEAEERHRPGSPEKVRDFLQHLGYSGHFIRDWAVHPIARFEPNEMQALRHLEVAPRIMSPYVNNFIFIPSNRDEGAMLAAINNRLVGLKYHYLIAK